MYNPVNPLIFTAAYAGALAGMGASGRLPIDTNSNDSLMVNIAMAAGAFAIEFDTKFATSGIAIDFLSINSTQEVCEAAWQERNPVLFDIDVPSSYSGLASALIAIIKSGEAYFAGQDIAPPAIGGGGSIDSVTATGPLVSSGGINPNLTITAATDVAAGSMSAADKTKLDGIAAFVTAVTGTAPIVSSGGATPVLSISPATDSAAGSMSSADKTKLDGITNAGVIVPSQALNAAIVNIPPTNAVTNITADMAIYIPPAGTAKVDVYVPYSWASGAISFFLLVDDAPFDTMIGSGGGPSSGGGESSFFWEGLVTGLAAGNHNFAIAASTGSPDFSIPNGPHARLVVSPYYLAY
jgi:hypothetical protein